MTAVYRHVGRADGERRVDGGGKTPQQQLRVVTVTHIGTTTAVQLPDLIGTGEPGPVDVLRQFDRAVTCPRWSRPLRVLVTLKIAGQSTESSSADIH